MDTDWKEKYKLAIIEDSLNNKKECIRLCNELLSDAFVREDYKKMELIETLRNKNIEYDEKELSAYPKDIIERILSRVNAIDKSVNNNLTFTVTTCKRYNLFVKTINSFIHCCKDIELIDRWICIDDNSSEEDRKNMKLNYPFFEFYFKTEKEKGHAVSMNVIKKMVTSPYILHIEDDWMFIDKSNIIKDSLDILNAANFKPVDDINVKKFNNKVIAQVLFNKNYMEDTEVIIHGGHLMEVNAKESDKMYFLIHEHYPNAHNLDSIHPLKDVMHCAYWPHFSFRPSIFKREIFDTLGDFGKDGFFEKNYATKYYQHGYMSCFHYKITCLHTGGKTWEKNKENSYILNGMNQHLRVKKVATL